jgi:hypothetical protein
MLIRKITDRAEIELYIERFHERSKVKNIERIEIPISYMERSDVYGLFDNDGKMIAGYTLGLRSEYRLMDLVPKDKLSERRYPKNFKDDDCCEVVCLWKLKSTSKSITTRYLWPSIYNNIIKSRKKYLLGHNQNEKLDKLYSFFYPHSIYRGISTKGLSSHLFLYERKKVYIIRFLISTYFPVKRSLDSVFKKSR